MNFTKSITPSVFWLLLLSVAVSCTTSKPDIDACEGYKKYYSAKRTLDSFNIYEKEANDYFKVRNEIGIVSKYDVSANIVRAIEACYSNQDATLVDALQTIKQYNTMDTAAFKFWPSTCGSKSHYIFDTIQVEPVNYYKLDSIKLALTNILEQDQQHRTATHVTKEQAYMDSFNFCHYLKVYDAYLENYKHFRFNKRYFGDFTVSPSNLYGHNTKARAIQLKDRLIQACAKENVDWKEVEIVQNSVLNHPIYSDSVHQFFEFDFTKQDVAANRGNVLLELASLSKKAASNGLNIVLFSKSNSSNSKELQTILKILHDDMQLPNVTIDPLMGWSLTLHQFQNDFGFYYKKVHACMIIKN